MARSNWGHFLSAIAGGLVVALFMSSPAVMAANGGKMILGEKNRASRNTMLKGKGTAVFVNTTNSGEPAAAFRVDAGAPFSVNSTAKVANLNADKVDGKNASQLGVPSGAVMFFASDTCPSGWKVYAAARGRALVGLTSGGTLGGISGSALSNLASPTATGGAHNHLWSFFDQTGKSWKSFSAGASYKLMVNWGDGMDSAGSGYYPIAPYSSDNSGSGHVEYYTDNDGQHTHTVNMPYVQLLVCKKK